MMVKVKQATRVLVVEDDDDSRTFLTRLLRNHGFEVTAFDDANGGVDAMAICDAQIALLDVRMPGRAGDDLARELITRCPNIRVFFLTGEENIDRLKKAVPSCFVIHKPVDVAVLLQLMTCV